MPIEVKKVNAKNKPIYFKINLFTNFFHTDY